MTEKTLDRIFIILSMAIFGSIALFVRNIERDGLGRCVCDYVSGMTDRYAIETYTNLYIPKVWKGGAS